MSLVWRCLRRYRWYCLTALLFVLLEANCELLLPKMCIRDSLLSDVEHRLPRPPLQSIQHPPLSGRVQGAGTVIQHQHRASPH